MKKIVSIIFLSILLLLLLLPSTSYPALEDAYKITGRDYFPEVKKLIRNAKKSIYITMYIASYHPDYPKSLANQMLQELVNAKKRGVDVRVILDQVKSFNEQYNDLSYFFLKNAETRTDYDIPTTKLHDKLIVIDERIIIIGSHNWSNAAFQRNRETSAVIIYPELALEFIEWIESTPLSPRRTPPPQGSTDNIYIPYQFLANPKLGIKISDPRMKLYLYLLKKWNETGGRTIILDYKEAARFLGLPVDARKNYRKRINELLRILNKKFNLLSLKTKINKPAEIDLVDYRDNRKPFKPDPRDCFIVPGAFWDFGWAQRLSVGAKYFYFISLVETSLSMYPKRWWSHHHKHLYKKYHANIMMLSASAQELNRYNLLIVKYGQLVYPFKEGLTAPRYLQLPLYSWEWHQEELSKLKEIYGNKKVEKAIDWAKVVLEENNLDVIEKLLNYSNEYGENLVQKAVNYVSEKKIGNPKRTFAYIEGIILGETRDQQIK